ncbi:uncharacterized protein LOC143770610 isoform X1 [Ranitomeya variabilis]|uniref:uncharacterized protein LOC143770610 isoform X1 n=1 Tax=Ranitomeya variabilis TaxID=490064 RepID=UPI004056AA64
MSPQSMLGYNPIKVCQARSRPRRATGPSRHLPLTAHCSMGNTSSVRPGLPAAEARNVGRPPPSPPGPAVSIPVPCGPALMTQEMFGADRDNFENLKQKRKGSNSEHESDFPIQTDPDEPPRPCSHCEGLIIFISLKSTGKLRK